MKKIAYIIIILFSFTTIKAQKISSISPTLIVWRNNNDKISVNDAKYGVFFKDSLSLDVKFHKTQFDRISNTNNLVFEFRWYYYLSTRRSLMFVDKVKYSNAKITNNSVALNSTQQSLKSGWWEVQVYTSYDGGGFLEIGDISKFQIFIK